jgi:hypothetical protein
MLAQTEEQGTLIGAQRVSPGGGELFRLEGDRFRLAEPDLAHLDEEQPQAAHGSQRAGGGEGHGVLRPVAVLDRRSQPHPCTRPSHGAWDRRDVIDGQHGRAWRKSSDYSFRLLEKQWLRYQYNVS